MLAPFWKKQEHSEIHREVCKNPSVKTKAIQKNLYGWTPQRLAQYFSKQYNQNQYIDYVGRDQQKKRFSLKEFGDELSFSYLNHLVFDDPNYLYKSAYKVRKMMKSPSLSKEARWLEAYYGEECDQYRESHICLKYIHPLIGHGVFAQQDISAYSLVGEYTGTVRKRQSRRDRDNSYIFSYVNCGKHTPYIIDAEKNGNFTRFINHSEKPNLYSKWIMKDSICHIVLIANQPISKGSQLTYDYGPQYWKHRPKPIII